MRQLSATRSDGAAACIGLLPCLLRPLLDEGTEEAAEKRCRRMPLTLPSSGAAGPRMRRRHSQIVAMPIAIRDMHTAMRFSMNMPAFAFVFSAAATHNLQAALHFSCMKLGFFVHSPVCAHSAHASLSSEHIRWGGERKALDTPPHSPKTTLPCTFTRSAVVVTFRPQPPC